MNKDKQLKYINDFPIIISIVVLIIMIIFVIMYFSIKPYKVLYKDGYMVLSNNMTYNLVNNLISENNTLDVGVAVVSNGDYIYKQLDTYYVGLEKKQEVDYYYPVYSSDGLTVHNLNENVTLIDSKFEKLNGYPGLSLNDGILYNEGDLQPADDIDYLFLYLDNSIYINAQTMVIKTAMNEYVLPMNSPIYFDKEYINFYVFDGEKFRYNTITDIYNDSMVEIGDVILSYDEFLLKMGLKELNDFVIEEDDKTDVDNNIGEKNELKEENLGEELKPNVKVSNFVANVYSASVELTIEDSLNLITSSPMFEVYDSEGKLVSRKRVGFSGIVNLTGLSSNTEYKIIGTYKFKNKNGIYSETTFFDEIINTKDISYLEEIQLSSELGNIYQDQIEIKDLFILNNNIEAVSGIKRIELNIYEQFNEKELKSINLSYLQIKKLISGEKITINSKNNLSSNKVYKYNIKFYDKDNNELKTTGNISGLVKTSKSKPYIDIVSNIDEKNNYVKINITTQNDDNVYIKDYKYELYSDEQILVSTGYLNYEDDNVDNFVFDNLDYNTNYTLKVTGLYDLEDGNSERELIIEKEFTTIFLDSDFVSWYDDETLEVTEHSISADVYISYDTFVLDKDSTEVIVFLSDKNGNDILDESGELKYFQKYTKNEYYNPDESSYHIKSVFEDIDSNTEYNIKVKIKVKQLENIVSVEKQLVPSITTKKEDAFVRIINKKLIGNNLDVKMQIIDNDNLINPEGVIVEIYEGKYNSPDEEKGKYVYRNKYNIKNSNIISLDLYDYDMDNYTIIVSSNPYDNVNSEKILYVEDFLNTKTNVINVNKKIEAKLEMYEQKKIDNSTYNTKIGINYNLYDTDSNIYVVDCVKDNVCDILGYIDLNNEMNIISDRNKGLKVESDGKKVISFSNAIDQDQSNDAHIFYLIVEKSGVDLSKISNFEHRLIDDNLYVLASLNYNIGYEIFNINSASDFFDTSLIKQSNDNGHYVVTENLDFKNLITTTRFNSFNGEIDFQGYSVELYLDSVQRFNLFNSLNKNAVLKNVVLNYHLQHDGVLSSMSGFVGNNLGTIENVIVTVGQENINGRISELGLLAGSNSGYINNFVIYLNSDINMYSYQSSLAVSTNDGTISNGYVATNPKLSDQKRILLYDDNGYFGTITDINKGIIRNVYTLVDVISVNNSKAFQIGMIAKSVNKGATVKNTVSIATSSQNPDKLFGPNIFENEGAVNINNNYYVDTNINNLPYDGNYSTKIDKATLINKGFWEIVLNQDEEFSITSGYYPILKMNQFMKDKQDLIIIPFGYLSESRIDVLTVEVISSNIYNDNDKARIKVYVSNPQKYQISNINISEMTTEMVSVEYDETQQCSIITLDLTLNKDGVAKSKYYINSITYLDSFGGVHSKSYDKDNNPRIINVEMYRKVNLYDDLVDSINKNENVFLKENIKVVDSSLRLPENKGYSAVFNGNEKTIDFNNQNISRGYFIYKNTGTIKNIQLKNMVIKSNNSNLGFILYSENGILSNIDISNSTVLMDNGFAENIHIGSLVSQSKNDTIEKVSVNDLLIDKSDNFKVNNNHIGGIIGYANSTSINNSYVYNLNIPDMFITNSTGDNSIGGLIGNFENGTLYNCYSTGNINTEYSRVGGILGLHNNSMVKDSYSYMQITSSGNYVGGIVGDVNEASIPYISLQINNTMFIGKLINLYDNHDFSVISPVNNSGRALNSYALFSENTFTKVNVIKNINNLTQFDVDKAFIDDLTQDDLPYLKESSFVSQKIIGQDFIDLNVSNIDYEIYYIKNAENNCLITNNFRNVNDEYSYISKSSLYDNACSDYAEIVFVDSDGNVLSNYEILSVQNEDLIFEKIEDTGRYKLFPKNYLSYYKIEVKDTNTNKTQVINLNLKFYRKIKNQDNWNNISEIHNENVILLNDIELNSDVKLNKKIINLLGNGYTISFDENSSIKRSFISSIMGMMRDVYIKGYSAEKPLIISDSSKTALIDINLGTLENCDFSNINIKSDKDYAGIINISLGYIKNLNIQNIGSEGESYVGALIAYDNGNQDLKIHVSDVKAENIKINGKSYVGGIVGYANYVLKNIEVNNVTIGDVINNQIYPSQYVGGIIGQGDCKEYCKISNSKIYAAGNRIGGIGGQPNYVDIRFKNLIVDNLVIYEDINDVGVISSYIGGIYGSANYFEKININKLIIGKIRDVDGEEQHSKFNSYYVGGVTGNGISIFDVRVNNSYIYGRNRVGGVVGQCWNGNVTGNVVSNSKISSTNEYVGGILGTYSTGQLNSSIINNIVLNSNIVGNNKTGGIIGGIENNSTPSQNLIFSNNIVVGTNVNSNSKSSGGLIGYLKQVPSSVDIRFTNSLFNGVISNDSGMLVGSIDNFTTGSTSGYGKINNINDFVNKSNFKQYVGNVNHLESYQINSVSEMKDVISDSLFEYTKNSEGYSYFPILPYNGISYMYINEEDRVLVPYDSDTKKELPLMMSTFKRLRNYSNSYNNSIDIEYNVYTSDVDKINIEFDKIDSNMFFYYEVGDYKSEYVPINNRTYTLTYDFKKSIKLYISNGYNFKEVILNPNDLVKTLDIINGKTYYIIDNLLYSEDKLIVGSFANLYNNKALTLDGKIYDIIEKKEYNSNIDYKILDKPIPIYEAVYKENNIKTYYNYSTVNNVIKDFQLFIKNGNFNSISTSLNNKKDMYIIDYYNNNEIQVVLKEDGKLYSIKNNIKYPSDIINKDIVELYSNISSNDGIAVLKYENGAIYTFNYRTGELLFTNISNEDYTFLDYVKKKISVSSQNNQIENISNFEKYNEIELLKSKIIDISLEDAENKIYNNDNSISVNNDNYITVYNDMTQNYDLYKVSSLLNNDIEVDSETEKLYKNYELVHFYKTLGNNKKKISVSGIILFAISIFSVLVALILLIRNKMNKRGSVL